MCRACKGCVCATDSSILWFLPFHRTFVPCRRQHVSCARFTGSLNPKCTETGQRGGQWDLWHLLLGAKGSSEHPPQRLLQAFEFVACKALLIGALDTKHIPQLLVYGLGPHPLPTDPWRKGQLPLSPVIDSLIL